MKTRLLIVVPVLAALAAAPAFAQISRPERPYRGLFGGGGRGNFEQNLTATLSLAGGYDGDVLASEDNLTPDARQGQSSAFGQATGGLEYTLSRARVSLGSSFSATASYVPILVDPVLPEYAGSLGTAVRLSGRTRLNAGLSYSYQPSYSLAGFVPTFETELGASPVDTFGLGGQVEHHSSTSGRLGLTQDLTSRVSASGHYSFQRSDSASGAYDFATRSAGAGIRIAIAKGLGVQLGYTRSIGRANADGQQFTSEQIDAGLDFSRALSLTRRTKLSFSSGLASVSDETSTRYTAIGNAQLTRELGRTWSATFGYSRDVSFIDTFQQPVFSDGVSVGLNGLVSRRLQVQSSAGASKGSVGFGEFANDYSSYFGTARITFGITQAVAIGLDYTYYRYQFDSGVELPPGYRPQSDRQSVRAYVNLWAPLFQRAGRSNASR